MVFWPQDAIYLAISAGDFGVRAVPRHGNWWKTVFCGYACPQTVYTEILMWIERKIEGDRPARMKLDAQPMNARKFRLKVDESTWLWLVVALWTGFTFVGYFSPIRELG
jgi:polyferredoxin